LDLLLPQRINNEVAGNGYIVGTIVHPLVSMI